MNQQKMICEPNNISFYLFLGKLQQILQTYLELGKEKFDYKRQVFSDGFQTILAQKPREIFNQPDEDFFIGKYSSETFEIYLGLKELWGQIQEDTLPFSDTKPQLDESRLNVKIKFYLNKLEVLITKIKL